MAPLSHSDKFEAMKQRVVSAVSLFENREGSKQVDIKEIGALIRSLGINPSANQIQEVTDQLVAAMGREVPDDKIPLDTIESVMSLYMVSQEDSLIRDDYHMILRAFKAFDTDGKGYVMAEVLKSALMRGDAMTEDELFKMFGTAADESGKIYYEDYAARLANDGRF